MPTLTTTIEDSSPAIVYSNSDGYTHWRAGSSKTDTSLDSYSDASYMVTNTSGASATFSFYGTGVQLFGSKRPTHGNFQITIDAITYPPVNGNDTGSSNQFQQPLFQTVALAPNYHTVKMVNLGTEDLDLDFLTWQTPIGEVDDKLQTITLQDTDPAFTYSPTQNWFSTPSNLGLFSGGTGHATSTAGSFLELTFKVRDAIALYGPVTPNGAVFSVSLDGAAATNYSSATASFYRPQQLLYQAGNLEGKEHALKIQSGSGAEFIVDYAVVYTTAQLESKSSSLSKGGIIGVAIGGFFGLVLILLGIFFCFRFGSRYRKYSDIAHQRRSSEDENKVIEPFNNRQSRYFGSENSHRPLMPAVSYASMNSRQPTSQSGQSHSPPSTASVWSPPPGTHIVYSSSSEPIVAGPNTQIITIPFTPEGKYRPDLAQTPAATAPPTTQASPSEVSRPLPYVPVRRPSFDTTGEAV